MGDTVSTFRGEFHLLSLSHSLFPLAPGARAGKGGEKWKERCRRPVLIPQRGGGPFMSTTTIVVPKKADVCSMGVKVLHGQIEKVLLPPYST